MIADTGIIFRTTNNGNNWAKTFNNHLFSIRNFSFFDSSTGLAYSNNTIVKTNDRGLTWSVSQPFASTHVNCINASSNNTAWACCDSGKIFRTTNQGVNWILLPNPGSQLYSFNSISFINQNTGWLYGYTYHWSYPYTYYYNLIFKTINGGTNWTRLDSTVDYGPFFKIQFVDEMTGWLARYGNSLSKTTNGGITWLNLNIGFIYALHNFRMIDNYNGWLAGANIDNLSREIYKTSNGGLNWVLQYDELTGNAGGYFTNIFAFDTSHAWVSGTYSGLFYTMNGGGSIISIQPISKIVPKNFYLHQNYPNPFNPNTKIKFDVPKLNNAKLVIYDVIGCQVATLVNEQLKPGSYEVEWDGSNYASGIYFYQLVTDGFVETKRMILIK